MCSQMLGTLSYCDARIIHGMLCELALFFLIYTESANLRHTPELLWFLFWCMNHSFVMLNLWRVGAPYILPGGWQAAPGCHKQLQEVI
jgi:1,3-beta-glucan synthase